MKHALSGNVPGALRDGLSVVRAKDRPEENWMQLAEIRHEMTKARAASDKPLAELLTNGGYCAPVSLQRDLRFMYDDCYELFLLCRNGKAIAFIDGTVRRMVDFSEGEDDEFFTGGKEFMDVLNQWPYEFGPDVGYLYYLVKENPLTDPTGLRMLYQSYLACMRERHQLKCIVTDLPVRIKGTDMSQPKVLQLALAHDWQMMPRWVASAQGDIWQQAVLVLDGRPITLRESVRKELGCDADFRESGVWSCIAGAHHLELQFAQDFYDRLLNDAPQLETLPESITGIAA